MEGDSNHRHLSKGSFFGFMGVLVTIFLAVNVGIVSYLSSAISNAETRTGTTIDRVEMRINRVEEDKNNLASIVTDVRISLKAIETKLGVDERDRLRAQEQDLRK